MSIRKSVKVSFGAFAYNEQEVFTVISPIKKQNLLKETKEMKEYVAPEAELFRFRTEEVQGGGPSSIIDLPGGGGTQPILPKYMGDR